MNNVPGSFSMLCTSVPTGSAPNKYASPSFALTENINNMRKNISVYSIVQFFSKTNVKIVDSPICMFEDQSCHNSSTHLCNFSLFG